MSFFAECLMSFIVCGWSARVQMVVGLGLGRQGRYLLLWLRSVDGVVCAMAAAEVSSEVLWFVVTEVGLRFVHAMRHFASRFI